MRQAAQANQHGLQVVQRLAHAHVHDVAQRGPLWIRSECAANVPDLSRSLRSGILTCSKISAEVSCCIIPMVPVAQNWQPRAQPTCEETQTVARLRPEE